MMFAGTAAGTPMTEKRFPVRSHLDPADAAPSPLDLRRVSFGQRGSELWLTVRVQGDVGDGPVCVTLAGHGRVCVEDREVRYREGVIEATVRRRGHRTLVA